MICNDTAKPGGKDNRGRFPQWLDSLIQWSNQAREDFQLRTQMNELREELRKEAGGTETERQRRRAQQEDLATANGFGFKDHPTREGFRGGKRSR